MTTRKLGNSDLTITSIGFGAWAVGGPWQFGWGEQSDRDSIAAIHRALELGMNWIDTAAIYGLGHSEEVVAKALRDWKGKRPYVFTKCGMVWNEKNEVSYSLRPKSIRVRRLMFRRSSPRFRRRLGGWRPGRMVGLLRPM